MTNWHIARLTAAHDRSRFSCGRPPLDAFLKQTATQHQKRRIGQTFVATRPGSDVVIGYFTTAVASVPRDLFPPEVVRRLPQHPLPMLLLARLAADVTTRGERLGEGLLLDAIRRAFTCGEEAGAVFGVLVHAKDDEAAGFYRKYGFVPLPGNPLHLYLPLDSVADGFAVPDG